MRRNLVKLIIFVKAISREYIGHTFVQIAVDASCCSVTRNLIKVVVSSMGTGCILWWQCLAPIILSKAHHSRLNGILTIKYFFAVRSACAVSQKSKFFFLLFMPFVIVWVNCSDRFGNDFFVLCTLTKEKKSTICKPLLMYVMHWEHFCICPRLSSRRAFRPCLLLSLFTGSHAKIITVFIRI